MKYITSTNLHCGYYQKKKVRLREIKSLAQNHTSSKWKRQDSQLDNLMPKTTFLTTVSPYLAVGTQAS